MIAQEEARIAAKETADRNAAAERARIEDEIAGNVIVPLAYRAFISSIYFFIYTYIYTLHINNICSLSKIHHSPSRPTAIRRLAGQCLMASRASRSAQRLSIRG